MRTGKDMDLPNLKHKRTRGGLKIRTDGSSSTIDGPDYHSENSQFCFGMQVFVVLADYRLTQLVVTFHPCIFKNYPNTDQGRRGCTFCNFESNFTFCYSFEHV